MSIYDVLVVHYTMYDVTLRVQRLWPALTAKPLCFALLCMYDILAVHKYTSQ